MPTFRRPKDHQHPYAQIPNQLLEDERLSFKAKGLLCYVLSKSDHWEVYQSQLADVGPDGRAAVRTGLDELREAGYLQRRPVRNEGGEFKGYEYLVYEEPMSPGADDGTDMGKSDIGKPDIGKSDFGKSDTTNKGYNQNGCNQEGSSSSAGAREGDPVMPDELLPLYEVYETTVNEALQHYAPEDADQLVSNQWGTINVGSPILHLAKETEWRYFVTGVVITANEADIPNARYLDTLLTALTSLDEHTEEDPTEDEQRSNLQRLWNAARTA